MRGSIVAAVVVAGSAIVPRVARADDELAEARRLEAALEYERGLALVEHALARGGADPVRVVELHLLAGELAAGLDRVPLAEDHFARALALRPDAQLAAGTSPKLTAPLEAARARTRPLAVAAHLERGFATLVVTADPLGLVVGIAVHVVDDANRPADLVERAATRAAIPVGDTALEIAALDGNGNRIWVGPAPAAAHQPPPPPPHATEGRAWIARWPAWTVATGALAITGGVFAWRRSVAQTDWNRLRADDGNHDYSELAAIETRGNRDALAADVAFALAGATALTAVILYLTDAPPSTTIVVTPTTVGIAARF